MKNAVLRVSTLVLVLFAFLFNSQSLMAQKKGTEVTVITTDANDDKDFDAVTKIYEFSAGGLLVNSKEGKLDYIVYERKTASKTWTEVNKGSISDADADNKDVQICKTGDDVSSVKVEVKTQCEDCVEVSRLEECK